MMDWDEARRAAQAGPGKEAVYMKRAPPFRLRRLAKWTRISQLVVDAGQCVPSSARSLRTCCSSSKGSFDSPPLSVQEVPSSAIPLFGASFTVFFFFLTGFVLLSSAVVAVVAFSFLFGGIV